MPSKAMLNLPLVIAQQDRKATPVTSLQAQRLMLQRCKVQVGAQATPNAPRTNVVEMGRYLAQNGISVEQACPLVL
jgi:hypothetical protein